MKFSKTTALTSLALAQMTRGALFDAAQIDQPSILEPIFIYGQFDSISNYSDVSKYNLTTGNHGLWALSAINDSIIQLETTTATKVFNFNDTSFIYLVDGQPFIYDIEAKNSTPVRNWDQVEGNVSSVLLDNDEVYFGGDLSYNNEFGVVVYNLSNDTLTGTLFGGFNGTVNSMIHGSNKSIIFGGQFDSIGFPDILATNGSNSTLVDPDQLISLKYAQISSSSGSGAQTIVCPSDSAQWKLGEDEQGSWSAVLPNAVQPSKIRLYNLPDGNGVSLFRVITEPANGIMNMSYVDPDTLGTRYCDAWCPLLPNTNLSASIAQHKEMVNSGIYTAASNVTAGWIGFGENYQEFEFVNPLQVSEISIQVLDNYGSYAGLSGFEMFQYGTTIYANNTLNEPTCSNIESYSRASNLGDVDWTSAPGYLTTTIGNSDINAQGIRYHLNITYSGNYSVYLYTPGCLGDDSCGERGIVNASFYNSAELLSSKLVYQTNNEEKYDIIYSGYVDMEAGSQAHLDVTFDSALYSDHVTFVAGSVYAEFVGLDIKKEIRNKLNGLFEYRPGSEGPFGNSSIDLLGQNLTANANVTGLYLNDTVLYVAGDFESDYGENLIAFDTRTAGFNDISNVSDPVSQILAVDTDLVLVSEDQKVGLFNGSYHELAAPDHPFSAATFDYNSSEYISLISENNASVYDYAKQVWTTSDLLRPDISNAIKIDDVDFAVGQVVKYDARSINVAQIRNGSTFSLDSIRSGEVNAAINLNGTLILGGNFTTTDEKRNFVIVNGTTPNITFSDNSAVRALYSYKDAIYVAFDGMASIDGTSGSSLWVYNTTSQAHVFMSDRLTGSVTALGVNPKDSSVVLGGNFTSSRCSYLCLFDPRNRTLSAPSSQVSGEVTYLQYLDTLSILVSTNSPEPSFRLLNLSTSSVEPADYLDNISLPGNVKKFMVAGSHLNDTVIVMGDTYIGSIKGSSYSQIGEFGSNSTFTDFELVNSSVSFVNNQILVAAGKIVLPAYGVADLAAYNGKSWVPLVTAGQSFNSTLATVKGVVKSFRTVSYATSATKSSTSSTSSSSSIQSGTPASKNKGTSHLTKGQVVGVGLALSVGTMFLFTAAAAGLYYASNRATRIAPLYSRVGEEKMVQAVPPDQVMNNMSKAKAS
ncbi:hypothetical protein KL929_001235 [Ogataea haglerorum]|nr:hypothetical protein KL915_001777 [Ogataea haglerorum]KAG7699646.1 hypothetical protein KL951_001363 [Ogataea haglerorum]KAG7710691.1 hypothetical protein KL950_001604 [Ogataea haglerorum]KAG7732647.1 hypothetical protein KL948_002077 [Ogataea haglerorum]KAG7740158.1 hypothetical protein KL923_001999 [Ogataea haglerorum]